MTLWAESEIVARQWLVANIDNAYCSIDDEAHFVAETAAHYPLGNSATSGPALPCWPASQP